MSKLRRALRVVTLGVAVGAAGLSWLLFGLRESAATVPFDAGSAGVLAGAAALLLAAAAVVHSSSPGRSRRLAVAIAVAAGLALVLWVPHRFLSWRTSEVAYASGEVMLAGTVYEPRAGGPHPGVVLVHGSGPESRADYAFFARYLARRGMAVLAYDKRGVGGSTGELYATDYDGYARDALAGVRLLQRRPRVDAAAVGLVGFSEAEWVAPIAAGESDDVAFVVVIGAAGTSPAEQVAAEIGIRLRRRGYAANDVAAALALNEQVLEYQRTGEGAVELASALESARGEAWFAAAGDIPDTVNAPEAYAWWRSVMDFDATRAWSRVRVPVLLLKGGRDDRSDAGVMRERITAALAAGGNDNVTVIIFPDADHMLLEWPLGERTPPPVFADGYLDSLLSWLQQAVDQPPVPVP